MKIGVLTYHCPPNFGAQLQALSTIGYLKRMGYEPVIINWYAKDLEEMYSHRIPREQALCHEAFSNKIFPLSRKCQTEEELITEINSLHLDGIIVGSDALFKYTPKKKRRYFSKRKLKYIYSDVLSCELIDGNPFFGGFLGKLDDKKPAVVYAASSQNCPFRLMDKGERQQMKDALSHYNFISTRDVWTQQMIETIMHVRYIKVFPDPVFSFNQNCYITIPSKREIMNKYGLKEGYVLLSFSDRYNSPEYINAIANELEKVGLQPVAFPMPEKLFSAGISKRINLPLSPIDWYALIIHSQGYIGERMHPIVVCLHNSIPFYCFDEYGTEENHGFWRKKEYEPFSSKTFSIVSDAGFLDSIHSYKQKEGRPAIQIVIKKLLNFNTQKCRTFSIMKQAEYEVGMAQLLSHLHDSVENG